APFKEAVKCRKSATSGTRKTTSPSPRPPTTTSRPISSASTGATAVRTASASATAVRTASASATAAKTADDFRSREDKRGPALRALGFSGPKYLGEALQEAPG